MADPLTDEQVREAVEWLESQLATHMLYWSVADRVRTVLAALRDVREELRACLEGRP